jgi:hypothetical protein
MTTQLDRLTQEAAARISRRTMMKGTVGGIAGALAAAGLGILRPLPVAATACNTCTSSCKNCATDWITCCSPNGGAYCQTWRCTCSQCNCNCFFIRLVVCDDGSYSVSCPCCCFACYPCC